jgi:hypothetical protein
VRSLLGERGVRGEVISGIEIGVGFGLRGKLNAGGSLEAYLGAKVKSGSFPDSPIPVSIPAGAIVGF